MKLPKENRSRHRADRSVAWWSTLLLVALGAVLTALFWSGRMLLSLEEPGTERTSLPTTSLANSDNPVAPARRRPTGAVRLRLEVDSEGGGILGNYVSVAAL